MGYVSDHWRPILGTLGFVALYVGTFKLAWRMLSRLVATSVTRQSLWSLAFWRDFVGYRVVIAAPYLFPLVLGYHTPALTHLLLAWLALGAVLGLLRFFGSDLTIRVLWWCYGFVYDGLLRFWPYRNLLNMVTERLELRPGLRLLDLGCGTGNVAAKAYSVGVRVDGVDTSPTMLARARRKLQDGIESGTVRLVQQDVLKFLTGVPDDTYDRVVISNVLYAVSDRTQIWRECQRVTKPDGWVVATSSDRGGSKPIIAEHFRYASGRHSQFGRRVDAVRQLLSARLVAVAIIDYFISELARAHAFEFADQPTLLGEIVESGGEPREISRVYGGAENGVNLLFNVQFAKA